MNNNNTMTGSRRVGVLSAALMLTLASGCAFVERQPPRHPGPYNDPVDAFNAMERPDDPTRSGSGAQRNELGGDLQRLHSAREAYNKDQARQAAELRREQAACRARSDARTVPIQDGTDDPDAVYCQDSADSK